MRSATHSNNYRFDGSHDYFSVFRGTANIAFSFQESGMVAGAFPGRFDVFHSLLQDSEEGTDTLSPKPYYGTKTTFFFIMSAKASWGAPRTLFITQPFVPKHHPWLGGETRQIGKSEPLVGHNLDTLACSIDPHVKKPEASILSPALQLHSFTAS